MQERLWHSLKIFLNASFFANKKSLIQRYGVALLCVGFFVLFKIFTVLFLDTTATFHLQLVAVILSAWYGGIGPGILSTLVLGFINFTFYHNPATPIFSLNNIVTTAFFVLEGLLLSIMSEVRRQAVMQKDEFIGFASHELRNPIASIKAYASLLDKKLQQLGQEEEASFAARIGSQADKTAVLIDELLDITHIEVGTLQMHYEKFYLAVLLKEIIKDQQLLSKKHKIILTGSSKKQIRADKYRIGEVLINLITNAIKYSPDAKKIEVFIKDKKEAILISVRDYGIGIDAVNTEKIFERFFRDGKNHTNIQGLGLGLYIASQIIKGHQGKIWVESQKGTGSVFYIQLPAIR